MPDLVLCDIDGCLLPERPVPIDRASLEAIAVRNRTILDGSRPGAPLTICSGRPQPFAELLCRILGNLSVPCIAENGVWLYHPGTNGYELDPAITSDHLAAVRALEDHLRAVWATPARLAEKGAAIQPGKTASASLYTHDHAWLLEVRAAMAETVSAHGWPFRVSMSRFYLNVDLVHISKGSGVRRIADRLRLGRERLAGIGDTMGDLAIAENVGWFGCPANAEPGLKAAATWVATGEETAGVVEILRRLDAV